MKRYLTCAASPTLKVFTVVAAALFTILPGSARAGTGFTGSFNPNNDPSWWSFEPTQAGSYLCDQGPADDSCVYISQQSQDAEIYNNADSTPSTITWRWTNNSTTNYYVSFNYKLDSAINNDIGKIERGAKVGSNYIANQAQTITFFSSTEYTPYLYSSIILSENQFIQFSVTTTTAQSASLLIENFNYAVPAPLPAAGAATAFGYSRRLRRRIKGVRPAGSNKATVPSHPSVYLNLSPCKLPSLPVSFSYGSLPRPQELERHAA